jgi:hypothetical protein
VGLRTPLLPEAWHGGSACSHCEYTMARGHSVHSGHDDDSTMGTSAMARHRPPLSAMVCFLRGATSVSPRLAIKRQARGSAMVKQARPQASNHHGLATRATATGACARGEEEPNGGPHCHQSSSQESGSLLQPRGWHVEAAVAKPLNVIPPPSTGGVDRLYHQLVEIHAITAVQLAE